MLPGGVACVIGHALLTFPLFGSVIWRSRFKASKQLMIETNPILAQIADLRGRVESLRGYL